MRWSMRSTRNTLIAVSLLAAALLAVRLERHQPPTHIGCPIPSSNPTWLSETWVHLTFKDFHAAGNQFTGSMAIEIVPRFDRLKPDEVKKWAEGFKHVDVRFYTFRSPHELTRKGGSDEPIAVAFPPATGSLMGKGSFTWEATPQVGSFYYPFDRYTLGINPSMLQLPDPAHDTGDYPVNQIDTLSTDFGNSNFVPRLHNLNAKYPADPYSITLERPVLLRFLAIIVAALLIFWLLYLVVAAKPGEYIGQVVTLFVGVFSIRNSLLSGAPVFPSFIDYCALGVYLAAALVVLIKWIFPDRKTQECPFCMSSIARAATVCPECTRIISSFKKAVVLPHSPARDESDSSDLLLPKA